MSISLHTYTNDECSGTNITIARKIFFVIENIMSIIG
jgi:hypothetical protein